MVKRNDSGVSGVLDAAKAYLQKWRAREAVVLPENVVPLKRKDP